MSGIGGKKRENLGSTVYVGWAECNVIAVCPDLEELGKLGWNVDEKEEIEYTKENKEGVDTVRVDVYLQEVKSEYNFKKSFFLENEDMVNKPKQGKEDEYVEKKQWINQIGDTAWVEDKKDLKDRFKKFLKKDKKSGDFEEYGDKKFRVAKKGEADLVAFLKNWLDINYWDVDASLLLDTKKLFNGDFRELKSLVGGELATTVVEMLEAKTVEKDGALNTYQSAWKSNLPGYMMKVVRNTRFTEENIQKWMKEKKSRENPDGRYLKDHEQLAIDISEGEYRSKNYFTFDLFRVYDESENFVTKAGEGTVKGETKPKKALKNDDLGY